jgi:protein-tyrosine phosphatase
MTSVSEILPGVLFVGDRNSPNVPFLVAKNITLIVNCTKDAPFQSRLTGIEHVRVPVDDNLQDREIRRLAKLVEPTVRVIHRHIAGGGAVLIHCVAGKQRSATIAACYLMRHGDLTAEQAIRTIRAYRPAAFTPGINFRRVLIGYQQVLTKNHAARDPRPPARQAHPR